MQIETVNDRVVKFMGCGVCFMDEVAVHRFEVNLCGWRYLVISGNYVGSETAFSSLV